MNDFFLNINILHTFMRYSILSRSKCLLYVLIFIYVQFLYVKGIIEVLRTSKQYITMMSQLRSKTSSKERLIIFDGRHNIAEQPFERCQIALQEMFYSLYVTVKQRILANQCRTKTKRSNCSEHRLPELGLATCYRLDV